MNIEEIKATFSCLLPPRVPEALCFWVVRPSVRQSISQYVRQYTLDLVNAM